jgi:phage protein U
MIGSFGNVIFEIKGSVINNFNNFELLESASWIEHQRHNRSPLLEFNGRGTRSISFEIVGIQALGGFAAQRIKLRKMQVKGTPANFVIGNYRYGSHMWVISDLSTSLDFVDNKGVIRFSTTKVTLREYNKL